MLGSFACFRRAFGDLICCMNSRVCLLGLLIGLLMGSIALAVVMTMWLMPKGKNQYFREAIRIRGGYTN
jgi:hypothetical protein